MTVQLELFKECKTHRLSSYWRSRLSQWPGEVMSSRHKPDSSGWSMATQGLKFAIWLFKAREMHGCEFRRWCRFNRRVLRWDKKQQPTN